MLIGEKQEREDGGEVKKGRGEGGNGGGSGGGGSSGGSGSGSGGGEIACIGAFPDECAISYN